MDGDAGRLVQDQELVVLIDDGLAHALLEVQGRAADLLRGSYADGRNPDLVVRLQPGIRARPVAVDADFTFTDYPVNTAPRDVPQVLVHEVIEALPRLLGGDLELTHRCAYFSSLLLGHINLDVRHCFYNSLASILRLPSLLPSQQGRVNGRRASKRKAPESRRMLVGPPYRGHRIGPTRSRQPRRISCSQS